MLLLLDRIPFSSTVVPDNMGDVKMMRETDSVGANWEPVRASVKDRLSHWTIFTEAEDGATTRDENIAPLKGMEL